MFENFIFTDWLVIVVLWFQAFILLSLWWPRLSQLRFHDKVLKVRGRKAKGKVKGKDAYETYLKEDGGEKHER